MPQPFSVITDLAEGGDAHAGPKLVVNEIFGLSASKRDWYPC